MKTLDQFIREQNIRFDCIWADTNPNMDGDAEWMQAATHYRCILKKGKRQMTVPFSQGSAISREPTAADVLDCLASDAVGVKNTRNFEDWCAEYGYDTESRKAEKIFKTCEKQADQLERLLGDQSAFDELLFNTERL